MPIFVVHEHWASHHHFDFRLEMGDVLKSWAVPKGLPKEPGIKRLAIEVEDHPLEYADFEGTIPEGEYGAGKVEIWDKGSYTLKARKVREIRFELKGNKLNGDYTLLLIREEKGRRQWLLFKNRDQNCKEKCL
ncbi:MAG: DNA polymerase ligase N-terminal domain-containing protein [Nitrososphaerales archaeon]